MLLLYTFMCSLVVLLLIIIFTISIISECAHAKAIKAIHRYYGTHFGEYLYIMAIKVLRKYWTGNMKKENNFDYIYCESYVELYNECKQMEDLTK